MFDYQVAMAYRNNGLSNAQIAARMGKSYCTVLNHIGYQPKFMTLNNQSLGRHQAAEKRANVYQAKIVMSKIRAIDEKIIKLTAKKNELLAGKLA